MSDISGRFEITRWSSLTDTDGSRDYADPLDVRPKVARRKEDLAGWSPAIFRDNRRANANALSITAIVLDYDKGTTPIDTAMQFWGKWTGGLHTTYSHTDECPRFRVVLYVSRPMVPAEFALVHAHLVALATEAGHELDDCKDPARLWFVPGIAKKGAPYVCEGFSGGLGELDVDAVLAEIAANAAPPPPRVKRERAAPRESRAGTDRIEKYIRAAIDAVCNDIATTDQRNNTINASAYSVAGLMHYERVSEDEARGRIYEAGCARITPDFSEAEVCKAMNSGWTAGLANPRDVPDEFANPRRQPPPANDAPPPVSNDNAAKPESDEAVSIENELRRSQNGAVLNTFGNTCLVLRHAAEYRGRLAFNEMALQPCLDDRPLTDADVGHIREKIERAYGFGPSAENMAAALLTVASERSFHPATRYLATLPAWDGTARIASIATKILGLDEKDDDTAFASKLLRKWLISAVARVKHPGCKVDTALVLVGGQGRRKSMFFDVLAGEFFLDCDMDISNKDSVLQMRSGWIVEWGEIERITTRKHADVVKAFVSRRIDTIRAPFGRAVQSYPRASVIVGSTNKTDFLVDETGERRFWVIETGKNTIDTDALRGWRDQLWAEAVAAHAAGESWWLDAAADAAKHAELTREFRRSDAWEPIVAKWLTGHSDGAITATRVLEEALHMKPADMRDEHSVKVGRVMAALGWERKRDARIKGVTRGWHYEKGVPEPDESQKRNEPDPEPNCSKSQQSPSGPSGPSSSTQDRGHNENVSAQDHRTPPPGSSGDALDQRDQRDHRGKDAANRGPCSDTASGTSQDQSPRATWCPAHGGREEPCCSMARPRAAAGSQ